MHSHMNRRAMLAGVATAAVVMPAAALPMPDPIFAAIERHKRAYAAHGAADDAVCSEAAFDALCREDRAARRALLRIKPTTVAGAAALLRYAWEFSIQPGEEFLMPGGEDSEHEGAVKLCKHLALSLEAMA